MFVTGHIAASYLFSQLPTLLGQPLSNSETLLVAVAGILPDADLLYAVWNKQKGNKHHSLISHTPFAACVLYGSLFLFARHFLSGALISLLFGASLLHLFLDDLSYLIKYVGLPKESPYPEINWLYPCTSFHGYYTGAIGYTQMLKHYFQKTRITMMIEVVITCGAIFLWFTHYF